MKSMVRIVARLYPASWRARYGAEFDALLEDVAPSTRQAMDVFLGAMSMQLTTWNFAKIVTVSAVAGLVLASIGAFLMPTQYDSSTPIAIESSPEAAQSVIDNLPGSLSREELAHISQLYNLYPRERDRESTDQLVTRMQKSIVIQVDHPKPSDFPGMRFSGLSFFTIRFMYSDPTIAQHVEGDIVSLLVSKNLETQEASPGGPPVQIHVLDSPTFPLKPSGPGWAMVTAGGTMAGAVCGLGLAALMWLWRRGSVGAN
jgi:hypothetical protein